MWGGVMLLSGCKMVTRLSLVARRDYVSMGRRGLPRLSATIIPAAVVTAAAAVTAAAMADAAFSLV